MTGSTEPEPPRERPKVLYVMGAGRSGSTILGVCLGNCEGFFYAGELDKWLPREGAPSGENERRARFWREVREQVPGAEPVFGRKAHNNIERSSALFKRRARRVRRELSPAYLRVTQNLYRAIARVSGAAHVIDTSHYPLRARELQRLDGIDLYVLLLVRDPQGVVASFDRDDVPEPRFRESTTNAYLWLTYALSLWVFLRQPRARRMLVRHEDLLADPERVLGAILSLVGSPAALPDLGRLSVGAPLQGNRLLAAEEIALRRSDGGERAPRRPLTAVLQAPWSAVFARLRPAAGASRPAAPPQV
jgi:hypothetical protein